MRHAENKDMFSGISCSPEKLCVKLQQHIRTTARRLSQDSHQSASCKSFVDCNSVNLRLPEHHINCQAWHEFANTSCQKTSLVGLIWLIVLTGDLRQRNSRCSFAVGVLCSTFTTWHG
uniref:Uncharacterized protein n=1 Tax=Eutreptiella gymnastica TaxID=73025 RepID=A0A7S4CD65_9EUGL